MPSDDTRPSAVFFPFRIASRLIDLGHAERHAWNMPYVRAVCYVAADDERQGAKLLNQDEIEANAPYLLDDGDDESEVG